MDYHLRGEEEKAEQGEEAETRLQGWRSGYGGSHTDHRFPAFFWWTADQDGWIEATGGN